ncbi:MAG TPA: TolC family protein [Tepidisphaeraceae bacterium]|nr:TolC family protein [Tepidisphaeraceae bacterium]
MRRTFSILLVAAVVSGCSPEAYRRRADLQVDKILADRKETTLDYQPQTEVGPEETPAPPSRAAYDRVPYTVIAPPVPSPVEPSRVQMKHEALGPVQLFPTGVGVPDSDEEADAVGPEAARQQAANAFRLGPPVPGERAQRLDLFGALSFATINSRQYRTRMEELYLAALDVTLQRHLLSPRPFVQQSFGISGGQADVDYAAALTATTAAGVRQRLPYGGEVVAQTLVTFVNALTDSADSGESAAIVLSGSVPLLRGAGLINLEALIASERGVVYSVRSFEEYRRSFAVDIASAYFRLLTRQNLVNNRRTQVRNYEVLVERTRALYAAGRIRFLEVQRTSAAYLQAQSRLITAQLTLQNAVDDFKVLLGMDVATDLEIVPVELQANVPDLSGDALAVANRLRLDLQTARDQIEDARRGIENAENGLLPDLNLTGQASVGNRVNTPGRQIDARSSQYSAGVAFDLPVDRLAERNIYRRSLIAFERSRRNYEVLRDNIEADVRASVRQIRSAQATLDLQSNAIALARRRLEYASELLRQGQIDARDLVEAQTALLEAQDSYDSARADVQIALLQFMRDTGTLRVDPAAGAIGRALDRENIPNEVDLERVE